MMPPPLPAPGRSVNPVTEVLARAAEDPRAPAIVSSQLSMTRGDLADSVRRVAARLRRSGVRAGQVVAISASPEWEAVLTLAVMHEGAASLHASALVLQGYAPHIDVLLGDVLDGGRRPAVVIAADAAFITSLGSVNPGIEPMPFADDALCRVVFSSGTTGVPKGVPFSVSMLRRRVASARRHWMPVDPFFSLLGIDTVSGFQTFFWGAMNGAPWIAPGSGEQNLALIERLGVRSIKTSPARLADLLDAVERHGAPASIQVVQVAGALLTPTLIRRCESVLGVTPLYLYGSTEGGTVTRGAADADRPGVVGRPVEEAELRVLGDDGRVVSPGALGRVEYRTPVTAATYWEGDPAAQSRFHDGWFQPGDRGRLTEEGALEVVGRDDDVVNAGGVKLDLAAIDRELLEIDGVDDAASFLFRDSDGLPAVGVAFVTRGVLAPDDVVATLRVRFATMTVRACIRVDAVPRTATGKVTRIPLSRLMETR